MESTEGTKERRAQLDRLMDERRKELRIKWVEVARRADMSPQHLIRIRKGRVAISWEAADGINDALRWTRGSVEAFVTDGIEPTSVDEEPSPQPTRPVIWTPQKEADFRKIQALLAVYDLDMTEDDFERMEKRRMEKRRMEKQRLQNEQRSAISRDHPG